VTESPVPVPLRLPDGSLVYYDPDTGEILDYDPETGEIQG
jgi:hypothetical protein